MYEINNPINNKQKLFQKEFKSSQWSTFNEFSFFGYELSMCSNGDTCCKQPMASDINVLEVENPLTKYSVARKSSNQIAIHVVSNTNLHHQQ